MLLLVLLERVKIFTNIKAICTKPNTIVNSNNLSSTVWICQLSLLTNKQSLVSYKTIFGTALAPPSMSDRNRKQYGQHLFIRQKLRTVWSALQWKTNGYE
eukprot:84733_1